MAVEVIIPSLGEVVEEVTILKWCKAEGDPVEKGEVLLEVESEKVNVEIESPATGIVGCILYPEGSKVPITRVAAVIVERGEPVPDKYKTQGPVIELTEDVLEKEKQNKTPHTRVAPTARAFAAIKGVDLSLVTPTGPHNTVMKKDIQAYLKAIPQDTAADVAHGVGKVSTLAGRHAQKSGISLQGIKGSGVRGRIMRRDVDRRIREEITPGLGKVIPMNSMRQVIARRMSESAFTAPHIYFFTDICMDPLLRFRKEILADFENRFGTRPSVNDFLIKAVALGILDFPILNARIKDSKIHILPDVNISLAIALPEGLIVPAIFHADRIGLTDIVQQKMDLVRRARSNQLTMEELEGGTFTVSSLAQFDITCFTAIINPPQSGILSVGKTREELYMRDGSVCVRNIATFGLSVDHRTIDGVVAADFLQNLKQKLEKPAYTFMHL